MTDRETDRERAGIMFNRDAEKCARAMGQDNRGAVEWANRMADDYGWLVHPSESCLIEWVYDSPPVNTESAFPVVGLSHDTAIVDLWGLLGRDDVPFDVKKEFDAYSLPVKTAAQILWVTRKQVPPGATYSVIGLLAYQEYPLEDVTADLILAHANMDLPPDRGPLPDVWVDVVAAYAHLVLRHLGGVRSADAD